LGSISREELLEGGHELLFGGECFIGQSVQQFTLHVLEQHLPHKPALCYHDHRGDDTEGHPVRLVLKIFFAQYFDQIFKFLVVILEFLFVGNLVQLPVHEWEVEFLQVGYVVLPDEGVAEHEEVLDF
jgi:hypothetical protein